MPRSVSAAQARKGGRLRDASAPGWRGLADRPPSPEEPLEALIASVASLLEATARIQKETAEVLRDLAAYTGNEAAARQLIEAGEQGRWLAAASGGRSARAGRTGQSARRPAGRAEPDPLAEPLTARERAVLQLLTSRLSLREIGRELDVSLNTVKTHARAIYRKLDVSSRQQAVQRGRDLAMLPLLALHRHGTPPGRLPARN
jgi:ATP/maltotriose-dependent transcriptional regulator MalT